MIMYFGRVCNLILLLALAGKLWGSELSKCCTIGARQYRRSSTCSNLHNIVSGIACIRTASICCLRSLLDQSCEYGTAMGLEEDYCPTNINQIGGGFRKECCDCCLLAKDLIRQNEECSPADGLSSACVKSFKECCKHTSKDTRQTTKAVDIKTDGECERTNCEHFCEMKDGNAVCTCQKGYELGPDGSSCLDIDECKIMSDGPRMVLSNPCNENELCENFDGGYRCSLRTDLLQDASSPYLKVSDHWESGKIEGICPRGYALSNEGICTDIDECNTQLICTEPFTQCLNFHGSFSCVCIPGFYWSDIAGVCIDIDECLLLADDCLESQRCLNTPGSYKCIRTLSCGTGYALDSDTEQCIDVDECNLGAHDCGPMYQCRNTQGSYRCDIKKCKDGEIINPLSGECTSIDCPIGYKPINGRCEDLNECEETDRCGQFEECVNTLGSFKCKEVGNLCGLGYRIDKETGFCIDVDECEEKKDTCDAGSCINLPGSFKCRCKAGYQFNETMKDCEDIDECKKFAGHVCSLHATCENTIGSFKCHCKAGFKLAPDGRNCDDVDECEERATKCAQNCINIPGSYQCICERGYQLAADGFTCEDIDECSLWAGSGDDLCMGECVNTPGSYSCTCPLGYEIQADGRTCKDVDECNQRKCPGVDDICVNTLGSFKCHRIQCPRNYIHDRNYKNRCNRLRRICAKMSPEECKNVPMRISWEFTTIPKLEPISKHRTSITLFTIKGPTSPSANVHFELNLKSSTPEMSSVTPADRSNFLLQKGDMKNSAVIALRESLDGPQEVHLELILRLNINGPFQSKYVANLVIYVGAQKRQRMPKGNNE